MGYLSHGEGQKVLKQFKHSCFRCGASVLCPVSGKIKYMGKDGRLVICRKNGYPNTRNYLTIDHIIPRAHGGKNAKENFMVLCWKCNNDKGSKNPLVWATRYLEAEKLKEFMKMYLVAVESHKNYELR